MFDINYRDSIPETGMESQQLYPDFSKIYPVVLIKKDSVPLNRDSIPELRDGVPVKSPFLVILS
jgi:hypothetical protein